LSRYLLDTNIASHVIRGDQPNLTRRLAALPTSEIAISVITEAELLYGVARRGYPAALTERVRQFLLRVDVLTWDRSAARSCAEFRTSCAAIGITLAPLDLMIAAHAIAADHLLVTRDQAFARAPGPLQTQDWTA
jgi:tRNA(fMet)-specific endonuclease VapC